MDAVNVPVPPELLATVATPVPPMVGAELVEVIEYTNPRAVTVAPPSLLTVPLKVAVPALKLLAKANPRMIHTVFKDLVYTEFSQHILDENEEYVLKRSKEIMETKFSDMAYAFLIFDRHWSTMTETNKQHMWKYMKTLILLCDRVR